jgi:hypothetical protein
MVLFTWSTIVPIAPAPVASPLPQKSNVSLSQLKATMAIRINRKSGTSLAIVVTTFTKAACLMPLSTRA